MVNIQFLNKNTHVYIDEEIIIKDILNFFNSDNLIDEDGLVSENSVRRYIFPTIWMNGIVLNKRYNSNTFTRQQIYDYLLEEYEDFQSNKRLIDTIIYILTKYNFISSR